MPGLLAGQAGMYSTSLAASDVRGAARRGTEELRHLCAKQSSLREDAQLHPHRGVLREGVDLAG